MASLHRRGMLAGVAAVALAGCRPASPITAAHTPKLNMKQLNRDVAAIARRLAPGVLGCGLMNLDSGEVFSFNGARPFPLQGVAAAPIAAAVLAEIDAGRLSFDERIPVKEMDLSPPPSPVADAWPARSDYSVGELLQAMLARRDNTAADLLTARIGGPGEITAWLVGKRIQEVRIDRYQREVQDDMLGLAPFRPAWRGEAAFLRALATVPPAQTRRALAAWLADPRDTATPRSALHFLYLLDDGELIGPASRHMLLQAMAATADDVQPLGAGLPKGSTYTHRTGAARLVQGVTPAMNDMGVVTLPDKRRYAMAAFVTGASASPAVCAGGLGDLARAFVRGVG